MKTLRIGPAMEAVRSFVADNPGCSKLAAGTYAFGKRGRMSYVYDPVNRAIKVRLIYAVRGKGNAYALYVEGSGPAYEVSK